MGRDIQAIKFSGEDRGRYRDKLRRSLEVFARMLREHLFDAEPAQVGLEIELNLVDGRGEPSMTNADVLAAIADPAWATWSSSRRRRDCLAGIVSILPLPRNIRSRGSAASALRTAAGSRSGMTTLSARPPPGAARSAAGRPGIR